MNYGQQYYLKNKKSIREKVKAFRKKNAVRIRQQARKRYLKNRGVYLARVSKYQKKFKRKLSILKRLRSMRRAGLPEDEISKIKRALVKFDGFCEICRIQTVPHTDHAHENKKFRGLLCTRCNPGLGYFKDDPTLLRKAADYLEGRI